MTARAGGAWLPPGGGNTLQRNVKCRRLPYVANGAFAHLDAAGSAAVDVPRDGRRLFELAKLSSRDAGRSRKETALPTFVTGALMPAFASRLIRCGAVAYSASA